ncbi:hypothetical protein LX77_03846 [Gelidibacter algens]|uniref:Uncharacterized protein n=1 Tax=Gelidibacter algens TaxID=49280 RepID=A0A1A7QZ00_9FLAO|nr:hypothetical protein [Gelidibacter algens]OBX25240.1 hypothetical protein A9996_10975 [Gelidibacter algens]RAJ17724.1 hypothetical protein LX77_03846 [Gelidibacter algens]
MTYIILKRNDDSRKADMFLDDQWTNVEADLTPWNSGKQDPKSKSMHAHLLHLSRLKADRNAGLLINYMFPELPQTQPLLEQTVYVVR